MAEQQAQDLFWGSFGEQGDTVRHTSVFLHHAQHRAQQHVLAPAGFTPLHFEPFAESESGYES